jgi:hypothetical protein
MRGETGELDDSGRSDHNVLFSAPDSGLLALFFGNPPEIFWNMDLELGILYLEAGY